jgi:uncharacterized protein YjcR
MSRKDQAKALYIQGKKPQEIAKKLGYKAKTVSEWASRENWMGKRQEKAEKLIESFDKQIEELTISALKALQEVLNEGKHGDRVSASRVIMDISGLKREKKDIDLTTGGIEVIINQVPIK